jgi:hypothetical protein
MVSDVGMQMKKSGAQVAPVCSAMSALNAEVGEWLQDELIDLFGEAATLSRVLWCSGWKRNLLCIRRLPRLQQVSDKSIAYIHVMLRHMADEDGSKRITPIVLDAWRTQRCGTFPFVGRQPSCNDYLRHGKSTYD